VTLAEGSVVRAAVMVTTIKALIVVSAQIYAIRLLRHSSPPTSLSS
jgi:hypothetical protein